MTKDTAVTDKMAELVIRDYARLTRTSPIKESRIARMKAALEAVLVEDKPVVEEREELNKKLIESLKGVPFKNSDSDEWREWHSNRHAILKEIGEDKPTISDKAQGIADGLIAAMADDKPDDGCNHENAIEREFREGVTSVENKYCPDCALTFEEHKKEDKKQTLLEFTYSRHLNYLILSPYEVLEEVSAYNQYLEERLK